MTFEQALGKIDKLPREVKVAIFAFLSFIAFTACSSPKEPARNNNPPTEAVAKKTNGGGATTGNQTSTGSAGTIVTKNEGTGPAPTEAADITTSTTKASEATTTKKDQKAPIDLSKSPTTVDDFRKNYGDGSKELPADIVDFVKARFIATSEDEKRIEYFEGVLEYKGIGFDEKIRAWLVYYKTPKGDSGGENLTNFL